MLISPATPPRILVSNDDGIFAKGIRSLAHGLRAIGSVEVVAPNAQQSAVGHALTVSLPLRVERFEEGDYVGRAVSGTPADCVKLAVRNLLEQPPDLIVTGINHGRNTGTSIVYSGTVSGATEGTMLGIPSIAVSLDSLRADADFSAAVAWTAVIARKVLEHSLPPGVLLNVNVPAIPSDEIRGIRIVPQGMSYWNDRYDRRLDPMGREYYWLHGDYILEGEETDDHALNDGYVTVTPVHYRLTDQEMLAGLQAWGLEGKGSRE